LGNLLENALKFTNKGFIEMGYYLEQGNLVLYVKDTGIGVSPEGKDIIFERFSQENKEISSIHGGLGLGLSISKENARLLGGDITVESEKYKGSTFIVTIPYKQEKNNTGETVLTGTMNEGESVDFLTILVAEDEEVNYLYIEALFDSVTDFKFKLIHARNGKEAVEICRDDKRIDLILMDLKMPVMNGYEATEIIKSICPDVPVIAQTAYSTESDKAMSLKHGCDAFISKPLKRDEFLGLVYEYVRKG
ncbi:MAG TPA: response regulator, partial [Bacteroidales bacterium]|nr:response regulator [Bacteroidales bacterium]